MNTQTIWITSQKLAYHCTQSKHDVLHPTRSSVLKFLTLKFKSRVSYSTLCTHRSTIFLMSNDRIGNDSVISRFINGRIRKNPARSRYVEAWNVSSALDHFSYLNSQESLGNLALKTVMLIYLASVQRAQTISAIKLKIFILIKWEPRFGSRN